MVPTISDSAILSRRSLGCLNGAIRSTVSVKPTGDLVLELSYSSRKMRTATIDDNAARTLLGEELARSFHSLIADMRQAIFLAELPDEPEPIHADGRFRLKYPLGESAVLVVEPVGSADVNENSWRDVHRVKLIRIYDNGTVVL